MSLSHEEVMHIARLARLGMPEAEVEKFRGQLAQILEAFEILKQVDTTDIPPTAQSVDLDSVTAADEIIPSLSADEILANAPRREGDFFRVRAVLE